MHESIEMEDSALLLDKLAEMVNKRRSSIIDEALSLARSKRDFRMIEVSSEFLFVCRKGDGSESSLNVGFPFPIATTSYSYGKNTPKNVVIKSYIRGEPIRKKQRKMLHSVLQMPNPIEVPDAYRFNLITKQLFKKCKNIVYVDPYTFLGDSIIGLYILDQFISRFGVRNVKVFSKAYKHLSFFFNTFPDSAEAVRKSCMRDTMVILPDLIDNHWGKRLDLLEEIFKTHATALIVGRNMILRPSKKTIPLHLRSKDPLLINKNIEDYMRDCMEAYIPRKDMGEIHPTPIKISKAPSILFNGLSAFVGKIIEPKLSFGICKKIVDEMGTNCYVSMGSKSPKDALWVSDFNTLLQKSDPRYKSKIKFVDDKGLDDLARKIMKLRVGLIITADTSIAHLSNRMGLPNITIFNQNFWDKSSIQSLSSESPLGFCRYGPLQYPYILNQKGSIQNVSSLIFEGSKSLIEKFSGTGKVKVPNNARNFISQINELESAVRYGKTLPNIRHVHNRLNTTFRRLSRVNVGSNISWLFKFYDPDQLVRDILNNFSSRRVCNLVYASWLLSPAYKYML